MKKRLSIMLAGLLLLAGCGSSTSAGTPAPAASLDPAAVAEAQKEAEAVAQQAEAVVQEAAKDAQQIIDTLNAAADIKILAPNGAPAMSLLPVVESGSKNVTFVDGADALQAAFVNPTPEYDVIIAPSNLGLKLASADKTSYRMLGVVTWGNLYMVGTADTSDDPSTWTKVASFGEQSVTGMVFNKVFGDKLPTDAITWYNSTAEASAALLAKETTVAMLAEPNVTATIGKAKENGLDLKVISDIQQLYGEGGFPQAALFVRKDKYEENKAIYDSLMAGLSAASTELNGLSEEDLVKRIEAAGGAEQFGIPSTQVAAKTWKKMNINIVSAKDHMDQLKDFAKLFGIEDISGAVIQ